MRRTLAVLGCLAFLAVGATDLQGQVRFGVQGSYGDDTDFGIGGRLATSLRSLIPATPLEFHASFDYFFPDDEGTGADITYWEINTNVAWMIPVTRTSVAPYAGGGLNIAHFAIDITGFGSADDTEVGLNLLGGIQFRTRTRLRPFVEVRVELSGGEQFVLAGGLLF